MTPDKKSVRQAVRKATAAPFVDAQGRGSREVTMFALAVLQSLGGELAPVLLGALTRNEGSEGVQAAAAYYARGRLVVEIDLWAQHEGAPIEALTAAIGMIDGPPGAEVIDVHIVRSSRGGAPRCPRRTFRQVLARLGAIADQRGAWCVGASRRGSAFGRLITRYRELGYDQLETTYAHTDGATYAFFLRPPC